mmetsp:Transcript_22590/g.57592  ORF Transcript_22590/g.57592 Transcript_22590/m.57592 type:complete len:450 (+) Transcript_22590:383-1732(+)
MTASSSSSAPLSSTCSRARSSTCTAVVATGGRARSARSCSPASMALERMRRLRGCSSAMTRGCSRALSPKATISRACARATVTRASRSSQCSASRWHACWRGLAAPRAPARPRCSAGTRSLPRQAPRCNGPRPQPRLIGAASCCVLWRHSVRRRSCGRITPEGTWAWRGLCALQERPKRRGRCLMQPSPNGRRTTLWPRSSVCCQRLFRRRRRRSQSRHTSHCRRRIAGGRLSRHLASCCSWASPAVARAPSAASWPPLALRGSASARTSSGAGRRWRARSAWPPRPLGVGSSWTAATWTQMTGGTSWSSHSTQSPLSASFSPPRPRTARHVWLQGPPTRPSALAVAAELCAACMPTSASPGWRRASRRLSPCTTSTRRITCYAAGVRSRRRCRHLGSSPSPRCRSWCSRTMARPASLPWARRNARGSWRPAPLSSWRSWLAAPSAGSR